MRGNAPVFVSRGGNPSGLDGTSGRATLDGGRVQTEPNEPVSPRRRRPRATHGTQPTSRRSRHGAPGDMQGHSGALGGWAEQIELERRHRAQREQQHQQWLETFDLAVAQESTGLRMAERHIRQQQTEVGNNSQLTLGPPSSRTRTRTARARSVSAATTMLR
ncbi:hypothetical protein MCOR27_004178 [Pyricularia oryzae]|uniref:Uncharacterized protein n=1 Tax=Pyricularia grisea TaxID=148305 RepID=A0ABQ8NV88_PYRGI|nr:hypothetical protein MCOR01_001989 [Pyricularia oryzae]KAI6302098.1 hypothetical protein MCOR33_002557 [Pyricularia grisea]KAH9429435.1 hypothetical protein MCOR02_010838 [Pyricularia oryzae]KAI6257823.1 hypothetical protein MCOR19_005767 [Pyricularia oryzae]KAI6281483.1 hypothetical protein MCOR27_004178 [Pyricularia oryzae]